MVSKRKGSLHIKTEIRKSFKIKKTKSNKFSPKPSKAISFKLFFEKVNNDNFTADALLYPDILRYYFEIAKEPIGNNTFKERELQRWLILNNHEFKNYYSGSLDKTPMEHRIQNRKDRIRRLFDNLILLRLIGQRGEAPMEKFASRKPPPQTDILFYY